MDGDYNKDFAKPVDFCRLTPFERQKIKDTWLSTPRTYQAPAIHTPILVRKTPFGLSVPALRAKCSPHTELLAAARKPLPQIHYITKAEREMQRELEEEMTKEELKWLHRKYFLPTPTGVKKSALLAKTTPRIEAMSLARLCKQEEYNGNSKKGRMRKKSVPSHFPLPRKPKHRKPKTPRVCGCAESKSAHPHTQQCFVVDIVFEGQCFRNELFFSLLTETKQHFFSKLNKQQRESLLRNIEEHYKAFHSNYPPEADKIYVIAGGSIVHTCCSGKLPDRGKRVHYICELNKNQRKNFRRRMKMLGLPKKVILPDKGPDRGPKKKIKDFEPWITMISQPRYNVLSEKPYNPFKVKSSAKFYTPTERILILSKPREAPPPPPLRDFEGNELPPRREWSYTSRRRIIASPRTLELATPRFVKKKAAEDVKEDPFAVPRRALTAYCSQRTMELAEPKRR